jgi:hypothetical protein
LPVASHHGFSAGQSRVLLRPNDVTVRAGKIAVAMRIEVDDGARAQVLLRDAGNGGRKDGAHQQTLPCHGALVSWCLLFWKESTTDRDQILLVFQGNGIRFLRMRRRGERHHG